ncbi:MAG TPA: pitrilysin family protein [Vicinamibacterales bacterium]|nr:pitrilysin family protein [Vicinamibacterales bacterium]
MTADRFVLPDVGAPGPVTFPPIARAVLDNGLRVWSLSHTTVPVATALLVIRCGASADPSDKPGLAGVTADLLDEAAGPYDAIQLADAFARLGSQLVTEVGSDVVTVGFTTLDRFFPHALALLGEVMQRPRLTESDLTRVRELRSSRLKQLSSSASAAADRTFYRAIFGEHPYGHGVLGTLQSLTGITLDDVRGFRAARFVPADATLIVGGNLDQSAVVSAARAALGGWTAEGPRAPSSRHEGAPAVAAVPSVLFVSRPRAPQSELRVGHVGPPRSVAAYHRLVTLNAALGGQFSSRLNTILREQKGLTYGVHTTFDFRLLAGTFACETSVQADGTAEAIRDVLAQCEAIRAAGNVTGDELTRAKAAITRGYAKHFETADQLVRAAMQLATYELPDDTFDRFVPAISAVAPADAEAAAREFLHPAGAVSVVVGDPDACRAQVEALGYPVTDVVPEF